MKAKLSIAHPSSSQRILHHRPFMVARSCVPSLFVSLWLITILRDAPAIV